MSDLAAGLVLDAHQEGHGYGNKHIHHRAAYDPQLRTVSVDRDGWTAITLTLMVMTTW